MEPDSARLNVSPCSSAKLGLHNNWLWSQENLPRLISPTDVRHMAQLTSLTPLDCLLVPETLSRGVVPGGGLRVAPPLPLLSVWGQERWWHRARPPESPRLCGSTGSSEYRFSMDRTHLAWSWYLMMENLLREPHEELGVGNYSQTEKLLFSVCVAFPAD